MSKRLPVAFLGHGSPMNALEDNAWTRAWQQLAREIPKPKAILCLSAHYVTRGLHAVSLLRPPTIHDFYGFPKALFEVSYPAPGSPELAQRAVDLLGSQARLAEDWGLDHGAWSVLRLMYPQADIPVVQVSLDLNLSGQQQLAIGQALAPLRNEGILILGSGNVVHNLRTMNPQQDQPFPWALAFGEAIHERVLGGRFDEVADFRSLPGSELATNSTEHFVPLLQVLGAADSTDAVRAINHDYFWGSLSMTGYILGE